MLVRDENGRSMATYISVNISCGYLSPVSQSGNKNVVGNVPPPRDNSISLQFGGIDGAPSGINPMVVQRVTFSDVGASRQAVKNADRGQTSLGIRYCFGLVNQISGGSCYLVVLGSSRKRIKGGQSMSPSRKAMTNERGDRRG